MIHACRGIALTLLISLSIAPACAADAASTLDEYSIAWQNIAAYTAIISVFEQLHEQRESMRIDYAFRRPTDVRIHVIEGPNAGAILNWNGGPTLQARRGSGLIGIFRRTLRLNEPLATTIRGSSIDRLSFESILEHIRNTKGNLTLDQGRLTLIPREPATDGGLTREVFEFSPTSHLPISALAYEGNTLVRKVQFTDVRVDAR